MTRLVVSFSQPGAARDAAANLAWVGGGRCRSGGAGGGRRIGGSGGAAAATTAAV